jgi:hypothetical protein
VLLLSDIIIDIIINFFIFILLNKKLQNHINKLRSNFILFYFLKKRDKKKNVNNCVFR